ncbi:hypothetical protein CCAX7_56200 [Capsulimonas corticalis]|uniref:Uncharacterized protein n=1 Tax=Capsulimonas corticalis TaxID=2219043 RepID=A0A402D0L9_9BACT|nr:hypothetical protein [Capsulimonas corticalis]BDI33569.1 hypothetical protein CCAX7_56200 [Capsulimonas corticalis]
MEAVSDRGDNEALDFIRSHPQMFLGPQIPTAELLADALADAARHSGSHVRICRMDDWWIVTAEHDWLAAFMLPGHRSVFTNVIRFPEQCVNCCRPEAVVTAFGRDVVTATEAGWSVIVGEGMMQEDRARLMAILPRWRRLVAFRMGE